jgi:hypothetical protein
MTMSETQATTILAQKSAATLTAVVDGKKFSSQRDNSSCTLNASPSGAHFRLTFAPRYRTLLLVVTIVTIKLL